MISAVVSPVNTPVCFLTFFLLFYFERLRSIHAKKTGRKDGGLSGENNNAFVLPSVQSKSKRKEGDSEEEEDEDDDSDDQRDDDDEEEEEAVGKKGKKAEICEEEVSEVMASLTGAAGSICVVVIVSLFFYLQDDSVRSASIEELEKQIEKTYKVS